MGSTEPFVAASPATTDGSFELDATIDWASVSLQFAESSWLPRFECDAVEDEYMRFAYHSYPSVMYACVGTGVASSVAMLIWMFTSGVDQSYIVPAFAGATAVMCTHLITLLILRPLRLKSSVVTAEFKRTLTKRLHWSFVIFAGALVPFIALGEARATHVFCDNPHSDDCTRAVTVNHAVLVFVISYFRGTKHVAALLLLLTTAVAVVMLTAQWRPQEDALVVIWMECVMAVACFCTSHYRDVATRGYFKTLLRLAVNRLSVSKQRNRIALIVRSAVPARLARRLAKAATIQIPFSALGDRSVLGSVCVTAAADFEKWSTSLLLTQIVSALHHLYTVFDAACDVYGVDRAGTYGDTYIVTGGLVRNSPATAAHAAFFGLWQLQLREAPIVALRSFVASGQLSASIVGGAAIRYVLHGQAFDVALAAIQVVSPGRLWCTLSTIDELGRVSPGHFVAREEIDEAKLYSLTMAGPRTSGSANSSRSSTADARATALLNNSTTQLWLKSPNRSTGRRLSSSGSSFVVGAAAESVESHAEAFMTASGSGTAATTDHMVDFAKFAMAFRLEPDSVAGGEEPESWQQTHRPIISPWKGEFEDPQDERAFKAFTALHLRKHAPQMFFICGLSTVFVLAGLVIERLTDHDIVHERSRILEILSFADVAFAAVLSFALAFFSSGTCTTTTPSPLVYAITFGLLFWLLVLPSFLLGASVMSNPFWIGFGVLAMYSSVARSFRWQISLLLSLVFIDAPVIAAAMLWRSSGIGQTVWGAVAMILASFGSALDSSWDFRCRFALATQVQSESTAANQAVALLRQLLSCVLPPHVVNLAVHSTEIDLQRSELTGESKMMPHDRLALVRTLVHHTEPTDRLADCVVLRVEFLASGSGNTDADALPDDAYYRRWTSVADILAMTSQGYLQQVEGVGDGIVVAGPLVPAIEFDSVGRATCAAINFLAALRVRLGLSFKAVATLDEAYGALLGRGALRYCLFGVSVRHSAALLRAASGAPGRAMTFVTRPFLAWLADSVNRSGQQPPWPLPHGMRPQQRWMVRSVGLTYVWPISFDVPMPQAAQ